MQGGYGGYGGGGFAGAGGPGRQIYIANVCSPAEASIVESES